MRSASRIASGPPSPRTRVDATESEIDTQERRTRLGLVSLTFIWGLNFPFVKLVLDDIPPLAFNALRFPVAAAVIALFVLPWRPVGRPIRWPDRGDLLPILGISLLGNVGYQLLFIWGLDMTRAGNASLFLSTIPAWAAMFAVGFGGERVSSRQWTGIAGALLGAAVLVVGGQGVTLEGATLLGDVVMVLAAISWATFSVLARPYISRYGAIPFAAWSLWIGTPILLAIGWRQLAAAGLG